MKSLLFAISIILFLNPVFCHAKNTELLCSYNAATDDGKYRIVTSDSLKVLEQVSENGTFSIPANAPKNIVAIMCARSFSLPVVADALVLKAGFALYIASADDLGNQTLLNLKVTDNIVTYELISGALSDGQILSLGKIVKEMNQTYFTKKQTKSHFTQEPQLAPNAPQDKPVHTEGDQVSQVQKAIAPYVAKAKATYPTAKNKFLSGLPKDQSFFVTTVLSDKSNRREQVFIAVSSIKDGIITGRVWSNIISVQGYKLGDSYSFREADILDWLITHPDGSEEGNFVGKFLDTYRP